MNIIIQIFLPLSLAVIMFSMGLTLRVEDFKRIGQFPKAFAGGLLLQILVLPVIAFTLAHLQFGLDLAPAYDVGLIIIAACPGGVTSNLFTHLSKGDTALSISLTAVISILSVFTLPFIVNLGLEQFMGPESQVELPIAKTIAGIFVITTVPVAIGMWFNHKKSGWTNKWEPRFNKLAVILFVVIIVAAVAKDWALLQEGFHILGPFALMLNLSTMLIAYLAAKAFKLGQAQVTAITYECGLQNGTLAVLVSLTFLANEKMMLPGAVYSILMFFSAAAFWMIRRRD